MRNQIRSTTSIVIISSLVLGLAIQASSQADLGNRWEGLLKKKPIGVVAIELRALHGFREEKEYAKRDTLKVKFYLSEPSQSSDILLNAQEIERSKLYWMKAKSDSLKPMKAKSDSLTQGWNDFAPWPVDTVLRRHKIRMFNLGVLVKLPDRNEIPAYAPAILYHSSPPPPPPPPGTNQYTAYFRPGCSFDSLRYEIYRGCGGNDLIKTGLEKEHMAGVPFEISFNLLESAPGWVKFKIIGHPKNPLCQGSQVLEYCFYHILKLEN